MKKFVQEKYIRMMNLDKLQKKSDGKFNFRCPICGDSKKNPNKKRGWFIWNNSYNTYVYNCFNCDHKTNFEGMLRTLNQSLMDDYKLEIKEETLSSFKKDLQPKSESKLFKFDSFNFPDGSSPCQNNEDCIKYVEKRHVPYKHYKDWKYHNGNVLIPFFRDGDLFGYQERSIKSKHFHIELDESEYKIWNYEHDSSKKFFFESVFCAAAFDSIDWEQLQGTEYRPVALVGRKVPKDLELDILELGGDAYFIFDNDIDGRKSLDEYSKMFPDANFLIWDKNIKFKDFSEVLDTISVDKIKKWFFSSFRTGRDVQLIL